MHHSARALLALLVIAPAAHGGSSLAGGVLIAQASPRTPELDKAESQMEAGDFEEAVNTLHAGLSQPDLTDDQLVELYKQLGLAELYLGNEDGAREAFTRLLQARPDYELPRNAPPKVKRLYARILDDIRKRRVRPVTLSVAPIPDSAGNEPVVAHARIEDLSLGARAKLYFRRAGAQTYSSVDFVRDRGESFEAGRAESGSAPGSGQGPQGVRYTAVIPAYEVPAEARGYDIEYYAEVSDAAQRRLAGRGDAYNPLTFHIARNAPLTPVARTEVSPWYQNPWVWVAGGAVAAGAAVGIYFVATSHPTGTVVITIRGSTQ